MSYRSEVSEGTFNLVIYESEYRQIQAWTNKHQDLETGGDLFGLWQDDRTAVVQLVVGPGKQCRRTSTSFYQDIGYLERMGDVLTSEEGLCHIGEWHSHHTLGLSRPSGGDESTIWSNMDRYGLSRFLLFIANISTTWSWSHLSYLLDETTVNGFLFEVDRGNQHHRRLPVLQAEFVFLQEESPFRSKYFTAIREGAESLNSAQDQLRVVVKKYQQMESGWKEDNKKLETSLAKEQKARKETDRRLRSSEQQAISLQKSLTAQTKAREEAERQLYSIKQQAYQLQSSLTEQTKARKEAERQLYTIMQQAYQLQSSLTEQTKAREEAERQLYTIMQQSPHIFQSSFSEERKARQEAEWQHGSSEQRSHQLETLLAAEIQARKELKASLTEEQKAHGETARYLCNREQISHELETSLAAQTQAREETERRLHSSEQRSHELQTSLVAEQKSHEETRRHLTRSKHQNTLATVQQDIQDHRSSKITSCDWILGRDEVILSDTIIREGLWGRMVEGKFGKYRKVAVTDTRHLDILSSENRKLFEREMETAFESRHPCLLEFIGATNDDQSPLFVTELLETSLRAVLHERPLEPTEVTTIALDVAEGLNYLHLNSPDPIIHRDISSANVLLWKKGTDWRAKVSNCIANNFLQQSMTVSPLDVNYAAPEVQILQSPKFDVYSFGVLLCEMYIREPPDEVHRDNQIDKVPHKYRMFIRRCLRKLPEIRPSMKENIEKIKNSHSTW